ncbi:MAG: helix-turn-helix transcriptional regulator [Chitinispirillaceae bacterium]|jgi:transcriptional regulator with XRE-family HTH domain
MNTNNKNINEALRLLRVFSDIKSKDMAKALDISPSYLSEIESGKKEPSLALIGKYSKQLKTSPSSLLFFAESLGSQKNRITIKQLFVNRIIGFLQSVESDNAEKLPA